MTVEPIEGPIHPPHEWISDLEFESHGPLRRTLRAYVANPFANYFPHAVQRAFFRIMRSELVAANWTDPGGWQSMVISYADRRKRIADKFLCTFGTMPMALRNRRKLAARVLTRLIDQTPDEPVEVLCLGAGPGHIINDAMREAKRRAHATLVDLSSAAFDYGRRLAESTGVCDRVRFIQGDVRDVARMLDRPPHIVKMLGICEYIDDECLTGIVRTVADVMPRGSHIVFNSLSKAHGTNRFFRRVFRLKMIHRSPERLQELLRPAGITDFTTLAEPLGVYHVIVGRKEDGEDKKPTPAH